MAEAKGETSAWQKRFGEPFVRKMLPFGCLVHYLPPPDGRVLRGKVDSRFIPGVFLGHYVKSGGVLGPDMCVVDLKEFDNIEWRTAEVPSGQGHRKPHVDLSLIHI